MARIKTARTAGAEEARDSDCTICDGAGYLAMGESNEYKRPCVCTLRYLYKRALGDEVYNAEPLDDSPFAALTDSSLFIKANRRDFLPHLRHALISRGTQFFHRVTNDSQMLSAWLSKDKETSKEEGSTKVTFTSLIDLVEDPQLLIVFLGVVSYKNRALPGVLLEGLRIRRFAGKPTWVVTSHKRPFVDGHFAWSPESEEYLLENFQQHTIKASRNDKTLYEGVTVVQGDEADLDEKEAAKRKTMRAKRAANSIL